MSDKQIDLLSDFQIRQKLKRMAYQIVENNMQSEVLFIGGIGERGGYIAELLCKELTSINNLKLTKFDIKVTEGNIIFSRDLKDLVGKSLILVDDVLNTGKTLMQVLVEVSNFAPDKIETCFLAQRSHRKYPVKGDYVGISLATTFQEHIYFDASDKEKLRVYLV
jgi:pyrimidine operon attenuation protein/uracil phosphoribosyltransferase